MGNRWSSLVMSACFLCACSRTAAPDVQRGEQVSGKPAPKVEGPRIVERDVPTEAPLVGEPGLQENGYPWRRPNKVELLNLLRLQRFAELDRFFAYYQDAFEKDYHYEDWPDQATSAFYVADPALEPLLNDWVQSSPRSFAAVLARGNYRYRLGWHYRGHRFVNETDKKQFEAMEEYFAAARKDFEQALKLRPNLQAAYRRLISMEHTGKAERGIGRLLDAALALCPLCYVVRAAAMNSLTPRWGGSYEWMRDFAAKTSIDFGKSPRLRLLNGFEDTDRCSVAIRKSDYAQAHLDCDRALENGDEPEALRTTARLLSLQKRDQEALALLARALRIDAQDRDALAQRARIQAPHDVASAANDALLARHLDPSDKELNELVAWLVQKLRADGYALTQAGKPDQAAKLFSLGLQLAPDDRDLLLRMGHSQTSTDLSPESIQAQLDAAPDDFDLRQRIDSGLAASNRYAEVVRMWDSFIVAHLQDPRPLWERAGAQWHLRNIDAALGDMQTACALGMAKACSDLPRMKAMAGR